MSRFECLDYDDEGVPWQFWEVIVSRALGSERGQEALADMEEALLALPERKLIEGHLAKDDGVCGIGALVAHKRAKDRGIAIHEAIAELAEEAADEEFSYDPNRTADAGVQVGLRSSVAWHLAYLNDEQFRDLSPDDRYEKMLAWVRRAQGKTETAIA